MLACLPSQSPYAKTQSLPDQRQLASSPFRLDVRDASPSVYLDDAAAVLSWRLPEVSFGCPFFLTYSAEKDTTMRLGV
jgi:hypothetical protein